MDLINVGEWIFLLTGIVFWGGFIFIVFMIWWNMGDDK